VASNIKMPAVQNHRVRDKRSLPEVMFLRRFAAGNCIEQYGFAAEKYKVAGRAQGSHDDIREVPN